MAVAPATRHAGIPFSEGDREASDGKWAGDRNLHLILTGGSLWLVGWRSHREPARGHDHHLGAGVAVFEGVHRLQTATLIADQRLHTVAGLGGRSLRERQAHWCR